MARTRYDSRRWGDCLARRVAVRLAYLGWSQETLGVAVARREGRGRPVSSSALRKALGGGGNAERWRGRFAGALGLLPEHLTAGTSWEPLVVRQRPRPPATGGAT